MKKILLIIGSIILIVVFFFGYQLNSALNELGEAFNWEHKISDPSFVLLTDSISPNKKLRYYEYQFDNGGLGYSRVFWSIKKNKQDIDNLEKGLLPDGYKAIGWTDKNELIVKMWDPYYYKEKEVDLNTGDLINSAKIVLIE